MELYLKNKIMVMKKNIVNKKTLSSSKDKRSQLLIKVDNLMEKLDNEYGPFLLDELNKRLEQTIEKFNSDLKTILDESFKVYDFKKNEMDKLFSDGPEESSIPSFIAEYEDKIKNKKNK